MAPGRIIQKADEVAQLVHITKKRSEEKQLL
jgi:hypothetical protein